MKQLRWKDFSLVSKIVIEVGMIAVLLFAMNMLFYVRINNSMQKMDNVYASNAELTELSQVFEKVQDNMYKYLKVKNSQTLLDYYQNEAKYRNELEKLNEDNINDPVKLLERNIRTDLYPDPVTVCFHSDHRFLLFFFFPIRRSCWFCPIVR